MSLVSFAAKLATKPQGPVELGLALNPGSALGAECTSAHRDALRRRAGVFRP